MPTVAYEVIIGISNEVAHRQNEAIAEASRYLAYADQSDTFGYNGRVFEVNVYGGEGREMDWGIGLKFTAPVGLLPDKARFEAELDQLAHVESWEEIPYTPVETEA